MTLKTLINTILDLIQSVLVPFIIGLTVLYFITGVVKYMGSGGNGEKRKEGVKFMVTGIIAIFIMISIWAIVGVFSGTIGSPLGIPQFGS